MSIVEAEIALLTAGDKLSRAEFLRRWEALPGVKKAELIGGIVYMPSPVKREHGGYHNKLGTWIGVYAAHTPGCDCGDDATWEMLADAPQPDAYLCILPEYGGQSSVSKRGYSRGAPELAGEACLSSAAYDLHQKKDLYEAAGVREYVAVLFA